MADFLIRGIEMPIRCQRCFASDDESRFCRAANKYIPMLGKPKFCPLVPVPPHGRLIDADALMQEFEKAQRAMAQHGQEFSCSFMSSGQEISTEWYCVEDMLENAPTIIPAEEVGNG